MPTEHVLAAHDGRDLTAPSLAAHVAATLRLGMPLAAAQLAQMAMGVTDTVLLGRLGSHALAAGGLATSLEISVMVVLQGVLASVSVLVAQARGAGRAGDVPRLYWTGMLLTAALVVPAFAVFALCEPLLLLLGEPPALAADVGAFVAVLRWCVPGALVGMGLLRAFLPAVGAGWLILPVTLAAVPLNFALCFGLIHGAWFLPAMGMRGAAMATVIVTTVMAAALLLLTHASGTRRACVRWSPPSLALLRPMLRLGAPIGATFAVETSLFFAIGLIMGLFGPATLAAHQIALTTISVAFMIPLGLAQAANVRVGHRVGAHDTIGARRAGLAAIGLAAGFELASALLVLLAPETVAGIFLDPADGDAFPIAVRLLGVAALFQVADGVQCVAAGALRGLGDARVPFVLATIGYWGIGFPAAWALTRLAGPAGAWYGLAAGLSIVAFLLTRRFVARTRRAIAPVLAS